MCIPDNIHGGKRGGAKDSLGSDEYMRPFLSLACRAHGRHATAAQCIKRKRTILDMNDIDSSVGEEEEGARQKTQSLMPYKIRLDQSSRRTPRAPKQIMLRHLQIWSAVIHPICQQVFLISSTYERLHKFRARGITPEHPDHLNSKKKQNYKPHLLRELLHPSFGQENSIHPSSKRNPSPSSKRPPSLHP